MTTTNNTADISAPYYGASLPVAFRRFWRKYGVFSGRASRSEFWWWMLVAVVVGGVLQSIANATGSAHSTTTTTSHSSMVNFSDNGPVGVIVGVWVLATILPTLALWARRLHDANLSGLFLLLLLVPVLGEIALLIMALMPTKPAGQRFDAVGRPVAPAS